jgi:hypothetical protein
MDSALALRVLHALIILNVQAINAATEHVLARQETHVPVRTSAQQTTFVKTVNVWVPLGRPAQVAVSARAQLLAKMDFA